MTGMYGHRLAAAPCDPQLLGGEPWEALQEGVLP